MIKNRTLKLQGSALLAVGLVCAVLCNGVQAAASRDLGSALRSAANRGNLAEVKRLVVQGADIHATDDDGWTPLNGAARYGHLGTVQKFHQNLL